MVDACWLPSAIMQTTGAILGIYVGIYTLAIRRFLVSLEKFHEASTTPEVMREGGKAYKSGEVARTARHGFYFLISVCSFTIIANALWLDALTANIFMLEHQLLHNILGFWGLTAFLFTVVYLGIFSIWVSKRLLESGFEYED